MPSVLIAQVCRYPALIEPLTMPAGWVASELPAEAAKRPSARASAGRATTINATAANAASLRRCEFSATR